MPLVDPNRPPRKRVSPDVKEPPLASDAEIIIENTELVVIVNLPNHEPEEVEIHAARRSLVLKSRKTGLPELSKLVFLAPHEVERESMQVSARNGVFEFRFKRLLDPGAVNPT